MIGAGDRALYDEAVGGGHPKLAPPVTGGDTRQCSVLNGLRALAPLGPASVVIHDAVRPFVTADIVDRVLDALTLTPAAIAAVPVADTLKRAGAEQRIVETVPRAGLWRAQTPQGFRFAEILAAHEAAAAAGQADLTDDAAVAEWAGLAVTLVEGSEANRKLTTAEDLTMAQRARAARMFGRDRASTCTALRPATMSGCAGSGSPIPTRSKAIPTPTSGCTRSLMRCWVPLPTAISASISPIPIPRGKGRHRTFSSPRPSTR